MQTRSFDDSGIEYAVYFYSDDFAARDRVDGHVRSRIWYAMQRGDVHAPFPQRTVHLHSVDDESRGRVREVLDVRPPA